MTLETLEPDYSTRLLAAGPVSPTDSLLQFPMDLVSPVAVASEDLLSKFRDNLRICGIPEVIIDLQGTATAFFQELAPELPFERLEFHCIHRSLALKPTEGSPRDVVIKFHYYRTKEKLLQAARERRDLSFQDNTLQLFADLCPVMIAKRRNLKPYLQILQTQAIKYRWGFPFILSFSHQGR